MKKFVWFVFLLICLGLTYYFRDDIYSYIDTLIYNRKLITIENKNSYYRDYDFDFV